MKLCYDNEPAISKLIIWEGLTFYLQKARWWFDSYTYVPSQGQLADILTKGLGSPYFERMLCKLEMGNSYFPALGEYWK